MQNLPRKGDKVMQSAQIQLRPQGPYSLSESARFLEGFTPAAHERAEDEGHLHLAFCVEGEWAPVGVCLRETASAVTAEIWGAADPNAVRAQVARILSLDVDGLRFTAVAERDPVVGRLQARHPGLRPVCFFSPYEAAAWALISHRVRMGQAANLKERIARELGHAVDIHGHERFAFPAPARLRELGPFRGLSARKLDNLRALAEAAQAGLLDAERLRSLDADEALAQLKRLPGIGDFSAQLILVRGAGEPDLLPANEPRLARAAALAYGLDSPPSQPELERLAAQWVPYRSWVSFLLRVFLEEETREIEGKPATAG
jgi:DNA-3-methyladenine glycosylase II